MSVEKLSKESKIEREKVPYTQICNKVICNIKDGDAFLVWCYLQSKTEDWKVIKQDIKNNYGFGDEKLKHIFSYLRRANLIKYVQVNCANGKFARVDIRVLSGVKFDNNQQYKECTTARSKTARAVNRTSGNDELLKKDITKQRKEPNKSLCASDDARVTFDAFWSVYPIKKNKQRAQEQWIKKKCAPIAHLILKDVEQRILNEWQYREDKYIPHPSTYLQHARWTDEITLEKVAQRKESGMERAARLCLN